MRTENLLDAVDGSRLAAWEQPFIGRTAKPPCGLRGAQPPIEIKEGAFGGSSSSSRETRARTGTSAVRGASEYVRDPPRDVARGGQAAAADRGRARALRRGRA